MRANYIKTICLALLVFFSATSVAQTQLKIGSGSQVVLSGAVKMVMAGIYTNNGTVINNGTIINTGPTSNNAGTYKGSGMFNGSVFTNNGGIVAPGASPGCT